MATNLGILLREGMKRQKEEAPKQVMALLGQDIEYKGQKAKLVHRTNLPDGTVYRLFGLYIERKPLLYYAVKYSTGNAYGGETPCEAETAFRAHVDWEERINKEYEEIFKS